MYSRMVVDRDYIGGEEFLNQAISLAPNDAETLSWSVPTLAYVGRSKDAIKHAKRVLELSPVDPYSFRYQHFLSLAYFMDDQFLKSAHWGLTSYKRNKNYTSNLRVTIASLVAAGQVSEARSLACSLRLLQPQLRATEAGKLSSYRCEERREFYIRNLIEAGIPA